MDHIDRIDDLREGVTLRAYGQRDPLVEFKNEAYNMFETLIDKVDEELSHRIFRIGVAMPQPEVPQNLMRENIDKTDMTGVVDPIKQSTNKPITKLGRNDPCWCGKVDNEGKPVKWKHCHYPQLPK